MSKNRSVLALSGVMALVLFITSSAWATYPGQNGRIAFTADYTGTWQLYTMNPDGSDLFQVTNLPPTGNPAWFQDYSPDGKQLVFCHDMTGATELYLINADGTGLLQLTHDNTENLFPRWSPDGSRIIFSTLFVLGSHHLATIRPDGGGRTLITNVLFDDYMPQYTVDGKRMIFGSNRNNLISALGAVNPNGSNQKQITAPPLEAGGPDVSPSAPRLL